MDCVIAFVLNLEEYEMHGGYATLRSDFSVFGLRNLKASRCIGYGATHPFDTRGRTLPLIRFRPAPDLAEGIHDGSAISMEVAQYRYWCFLSRF